MKLASKNDLNIYASGLIGLLGTCLLIIPDFVKILFFNAFGWFFYILGVVAFALAIVLQFITIIEVNKTKNDIIQGATSAITLIFSLIYFRAGMFVEGTVFIALTGLLISSILDLEKKIKRFDTLNLSFAGMGFLSGMMLARSGIFSLMI